jgi:hypothetical protein
VIFAKSEEKSIAWATTNVACRASVASNTSAFGRRLVPDQNDAPFAVLESGGFA